ncbi:MAG: beta strand repeat-containing protein [Nitrospiraceae bacterium]
MRTMTVVRQYLAAAFLLVIGLVAYGCGDSATVNPVVELASLTVDPGTLRPAFSGGTTQYTVDVSSNITSVTIAAQPAVAGDSVTINGQATTSSVIPLGAAGTTTPVNIVVSESGTNSRTYTVLIVRAGLTGNNSLQNLTVSPGTLDSPFTANDLNYSVDVANTVGSVTVTPTLSDPAATMTVNGQPTNSGQARTISLNPAGQPTNIPIVVTAQNGTPKTYQVTVSRGVSGNNNLGGVTVSPGTLDPAFLASRTSYTVDVASTVASISVTPTRQDPAATITVNGTPATSGQGRSITLNGAGSNTFINIVVTAQNGSQKLYTIEVRRAALGGNNNLQSLTVSPGTLNPAFNANTLNYTVDVASGVTSVSVTPTRQDPNATITVNGTPATSGQARTVPLNGAGSNTLINIVVTAQNNSPKAYTVNVARAALGGNNNLSALTVSPGTLNPAFNANTLSYTVDVASGVTSVSVTPTRQDLNATITVNGTPATSGQARTVPLNGAGSNTFINIQVTAPNGSPKNYSVNVSRAALGGNNNLQNLTVSPGTLNPTFRTDRIAYTVNVDSNVGNLTVTATVQDAGATLTINGQGIGSGQPRVIPLGAPGSTTEINVVVIAPNGNPKTYQLDVNRAALGGNNNLSALSVSPGTLVPVFDANTTSYTVNVANDVTSVNVSATKADLNAVMSGSVTAGTGIPTGQATIPLNGAGTPTPVSITVTAPSGSSKTYSITVNRTVAEPPPPAIAPDLIREDDSCSTGVPPEECAPPTSKEDNVTNVARPRFTVPPPGSGETAKLYINGSEVPSSFNSGDNTLRPNADLVDGSYGITYTLSNAGGESDQSPAMTPPLQINTTAP